MTWYTATIDHSTFGFWILCTFTADSPEEARVLAEALSGGTLISGDFTLDVFEALPEEIPSTFDTHAVG
jgi:hypothetical protein